MTKYQRDVLIVSAILIVTFFVWWQVAVIGLAVFSVIALFRLPGWLAKQNEASKSGTKSH